MKFGENLRRLRLKNNFTQEYVAEKLNVSAQAVSRWECSTTFPDVMILPEIAKLYCVTIDDLYRENSVSYESYAHRLLSVYETTRSRDDFTVAEREFLSLVQSGKSTMKDMCMFGMLYQYGMHDCYNNAMRYYDIGLAKGKTEDPDTYHWIEREKIHLNAQIGHHNENIEKWTDAIKDNSTDSSAYINLIESYYLAGQIEDALKMFETARVKFGDVKMLYVYGGMIYKALHDYDKAIKCFTKSATIDNEHSHALRELATCYEELGDFKNAHDIWLRIEKWYKDGGYTVEEKTAHASAERCADLISNNK